MRSKKQTPATGAGANFSHSSHYTNSRILSLKHLTRFFFLHVLMGLQRFPQKIDLTAGPKLQKKGRWVVFAGRHHPGAEAQLI